LTVSLFSLFPNST